MLHRKLETGVAPKECSCFLFAASPKCVLTSLSTRASNLQLSSHLSDTNPSTTPLPLSLGTPKSHLSPTIGDKLPRNEVPTSPLSGIAIAHPTPSLHSPHVQLRSGEGKTMLPLDRTLPSSPPPSEDIDGEPLELAPVKLSTDLARTSPTPTSPPLSFSLVESH